MDRKRELEGASKNPSFMKRGTSVHPSDQNQVSGRDETKTLQVRKNVAGNANFGAPHSKYGHSDEHFHYSKSKSEDSLKITTPVLKSTPSWAIIKGENSLGERVSRFLVKEISENWAHKTEIVDCATLGLEEWSEDFKEQWLHTRNTIPTSYSIDYPSADERRKQLIVIMKVLDEAEGLILVTGEFNLRLPTTVTLLFESLPQSVYFGKPCAVVCYSPGVSSGTRAGVQARAFLGEMSCLTIGTILALPQVHLIIDKEGNCEKEDVKKQVTTFLHHLTWYSGALSAYRIKSPFPKKICNAIKNK